VSIWYNISQDVVCYDVDMSAPNQEFAVKGSEMSAEKERRGLSMEDAATKSCDTKMKTEGSWPSLCCNEEMNLIITDAAGLGRDVLWPPSVPRNVGTYAQLVDFWSRNDEMDGPCPDPNKIFGYPQDNPDPWSTRYDTIYGGRHIAAASNIVFSNGLLDPWSAAGVYSANPFTLDNISQYYHDDVPGLIVQNISHTDLVAVIMELGGHHTDLMYSNKADPPCIRQARLIEREAIDRWIDQFGKLDSALGS
jgi:Serine carboxypeptidase S28